MKKKKDGKWIILLLVVLVMGFSIGYAYLSSNLAINGVAEVSSSSWDVYWDNVSVIENNVNYVDNVPTISQGLTEVTFGITVRLPGESYDFSVDAVNGGSLDAVVNVVTTKIYEDDGVTERELPDYLEVSITNYDGTPISQNQLLEAGARSTYKVRVHYKENITADDLPDTDEAMIIKIRVSYVQASRAQVGPLTPSSFANDSWATIVKAVKDNNTSAYHVGDTKTINLGPLGIHTLRIANKSTPSECSTEGFSQSACGFVVEFADIINICRYSDNCVPNTLEQVNDLLPNVLRESLIDTFLVSGLNWDYGTPAHNVATSTSKIYFFSPHEVWEENENYAGTYSLAGLDMGYIDTRQLDYYSNIVALYGAENPGAVKLYNGVATSWWLRTVFPAQTNSAWAVYFNGSYYGSYASNSNGVSPAFRIG